MINCSSSSCSGSGSSSGSGGGGRSSSSSSSSTSTSTSTSTNPYHPNTPRNFYRVIYDEALDSLITSLKERFHQPCFKAYANLELLLLKSLSNESIANEIEYVKCVKVILTLKS